LKRVLLVSGHYLQSERKAGFHWLAEAYWSMGWDVTFVTASLSWLSVLRKDSRLGYPVREEANRLVPVRGRLSSFVLFTAYHPANLRSNVLNALSTPLFKRYDRARLDQLERAVTAADLIIFESTPGLLLFDRFRAMNRGARFVYRVSDDLRLLRNHPVVIKTERAVSPEFDLVSVPSRSMQALFPGASNLRLHMHAVDKTLLDAPSKSPYGDCGPNAVFVGNSHFDYDFLERACRLMRDWTFHIIGPIAGLPSAPNVVSYGSMPFAQTVPYIQHADAGLQIRSYGEGAESLSDSLKVLQYSYCGLGVVAPDFLSSQRPNMFTYRRGDAISIREALEAARNFTGRPFDRSDIRSWEELAEDLAVA
jgi:2-beta-glucuronyltransferase